MGKRRSDNDAELIDDVASPLDMVKRFGPPGVLALAALLFVVQNPDSTQFNFLWLEFDWPLWVMLVAFSLVGALVFWFVARRRRKRKAAD